MESVPRLNSIAFEGWPTGVGKLIQELRQIQVIKWPPDYGLTLGLTCRVRGLTASWTDSVCVKRQV